MPTLELVFRIAVCSELLLIVLFLVGRPGRRSAALFFGGLACYMLAPLVVRDWAWGYWAYPVLTLAILVPAFFCLLMGSLFLDLGRPRRWPVPLIILTAVVGLFAYSAGSGASGFGTAWQWLAQLLKFVWVCLGLFLVLKDWQSDLVEPRRRLRLIILAGAGAYILVVLVVELLITQQAQAWLELANVCLLLCLVTLLCRHFFAVNPHSIFAKIDPEPALVDATAHSALAQSVLRVLQEDRFYAGESVTIKSLAVAVGSQEYLVRRAINGELGYRNFNAFINLHRVQEVASRLRQPEFESTPLLTLALDAGFRSVAPFNKAFKDQFSSTPSEFRTQIKTQ